MKSIKERIKQNKCKSHQTFWSWKVEKRKQIYYNTPIKKKFTFVGKTMLVYLSNQKLELELYKDLVSKPRFV